MSVILLVFTCEFITILDIFKCIRNTRACARFIPQIQNLVIVTTEWGISHKNTNIYNTKYHITVTRCTKSIIQSSWCDYESFLNIRNFLTERLFFMVTKSCHYVPYKPVRADLTPQNRDALWFILILLCHPFLCTTEWSKCHQSQPLWFVLTSKSTTWQDDSYLLSTLLATL
jgi:hypothetical protein